MAKKTKKLLKMKKISADKKEHYCVVAMFGLIAVTMIAASVMLLIETQSGNINVDKEEEPKFEYEGWIDCMPPLDEAEADLCRRAKEAGYDKIAY